MELTVNGTARKSWNVPSPTQMPYWGTAVYIVEISVQQYILELPVQQYIYIGTTCTTVYIGTPCTTVYLLELPVQQYIYWSSLYNSTYIGTLCTIFIGTPCRTVYIGNPCTVVYLLQLPVQHHFNIFIGTPLHVNSVHCSPLNSVVLLYKSCDPWNISQHFCERIDLIKFY